MQGCANHPYQVGGGCLAKGKRLEGSVGVLKWALHKLGWEVVSPTVWMRKNGKDMDIPFASPGYIKRVIED